MNWRRAGLIITLLLLGGVYLLNRKNVEFTKQDGFEFVPISATGAELKSVLHLYNPNLLSSTVKKVHERFLINGTPVGELDQELGQGIPGMKETEFPVSIRFNKEDYLGAIIKDSLHTAGTIQVEGEVTYSNLIGGGELKINQSSEWSLSY